MFLWGKRRLWGFHLGKTGGMIQAVGWQTWLGKTCTTTYATDWYRVTVNHTKQSWFAEFFGAACFPVVFFDPHLFWFRCFFIDSTMGFLTINLVIGGNMFLFQRLNKQISLSFLAILLVAFFGMVKRPFQRLSGLQLQDKEATLNHLFCVGPSAFLGPMPWKSLGHAVRRTLKKRSVSSPTTVLARS